MAEPTGSAKLTYEDFLRFPDDGKRHELIDGVHYVTPSPVTKHQRVLGNLFRRIDAFLGERELGAAFLSPLDVVFSRFDVVEPDLLYVSHDRRSVLTEANVQGSPDLVAEILSPGTRSRDRGIKRELYERGGVQEYWIVDPEGETIEVLRRGDTGRLEPVAELTGASGDTLETPLLPGLQMPLAEIFRGAFES